MARRGDNFQSKGEGPDVQSKPRGGGPKLTQADYDRALVVFRRVGRNFSAAQKELKVDWRTARKLYERGLEAGTGDARKSWPSAPPIREVLEREEQIRREAGLLERQRLLEEEARIKVRQELDEEADLHTREILRLGRITVRSGLMIAAKAAPLLETLVSHIRSTYCEEVVNEAGAKELRVKAEMSSEVEPKMVLSLMEKSGVYTARLTFAGKMLREITRSEREEQKKTGAGVREMSDEELREEAAALVPFFAKLGSGEPGLDGTGIGGRLKELTGAEPGSGRNGKLN
jgi:hypothetical protein